MAKKKRPAADLLNPGGFKAAKEAKGGFGWLTLKKDKEVAQIVFLTGPFDFMKAPFKKKDDPRQMFRCGVYDLNDKGVKLRDLTVKEIKPLLKYQDRWGQDVFTLTRHGESNNTKTFYSYEQVGKASELKGIDRNALNNEALSMVEASLENE